MNPPTILTRDQTWTNNSTLAGNALIVNGINNLAGQQVTFDGVGNTLVTGVMGGSGGSIVKNGTGTTTFTALNTYDGPTTVNGGLLLVIGDQLSGNGLTTVNSGGALGGSGILGAAVVVNSGGNLAPGSGGNTTGILRSVGGLTLNARSNFRIGINGTTVGTGYDRFVSGTVGAVAITGSNLGPCWRNDNDRGHLSYSGQDKRRRNHRPVRARNSSHRRQRQHFLDQLYRRQRK